MQSVIFCCNHEPLPEQLGREIPFCLLPLAGKPLIERAVESAVQAGCQTISVLLSDHADQVETLLGKGEKWGATIQYALLPAFTGLGNALQKIRTSLEDELLVFLALTAGNIVLPEEKSGAVFFSAKGDSRCANFFVMRKAQLDLPGMAGAADGEQVRDCLQSAGEGFQQVETGDAFPVSAMDLAGYALTHGRALAGFGLPTAGLEQSPGVRVGHGCAIHPGVRFKAPVLVGQSCQIARDVGIGPETALGQGCVVESDVQISGSVIMDNTYIGSHLSIENALVRKNLLVKFETGTVLRITDAFLLGGTDSSRRSGVLNELLQRTLAGVVLLLCSPLLALFFISSRLTGRPRFTSRIVAGCERSRDLSGTQEVELLELHFFDLDSPLLSRIPALWDVLCGRIGLVGVEIISPDAADELNEPWQRLRFTEKPGLINPWHGLEQQNWDPDEKRVMEGYYTQSRSLRGDMGLLWSCLKRRVQGA